MIVVADTSPLTALLTIGSEELLKQLFVEVIVPLAVASELRRSHAALPPWLQVRGLTDPTRARLHAQTVDDGEAEAIALAQELHADLLLIDERKGRRLAQRQGVPVMGLVGVVLLARRLGLISSARELLERLHQEAGVYLTAELRNSALRSVGE